MSGLSPEPLSRRIFLRRAATIAALTAGGSLLAACGGQGASTTATSAPQSGAAPTPAAAGGSTPAAGASTPPAAGASTPAAGASTPGAAGASTPAAAGGSTPQAEAAATQGPAVAQGAQLTILQGTYFVAAGQELYKTQAQEWATQNGATVSTDFLNWPDLQPKISAAIQAGGIDIVELWPTWNFLYKENLVDVTDLAEKVGEAGGGFEAFVPRSATVDDKFLGVPHGTSNGSILYRISMFKDVGVANVEDGTKQDMTWDQYFELGKQLKAKGTPFGQALGHSTGDPPGFCYPYMWSHGAAEVEEDGKTVAINKPEFVDGMKKFIQAWKDAYDETGTSWDDSNNNRAFLSGQISSTFNGSSVYTTAKKEQPQVAEDMRHMLIPKGPAGRFYNLGTRTFGILKNSQNVDAAKAYLDWWFQEKQYGDWWRIQEGYFLPNTTKWSADPLWTKDPVMAAFREQPKYGRDLGHGGPPNQQAALSFSKYIVVDMFAKAAQSGNAEESIAWAADQLQGIYGA